jgi:hypothetical protein
VGLLEWGVAGTSFETKVTSDWPLIDIPAHTRISCCSPLRLQPLNSGIARQRICSVCPKKKNFTRQGGVSIFIPHLNPTIPFSSRETAQPNPEHPLLLSLRSSDPKCMKSITYSRLDKLSKSMCILPDCCRPFPGIPLISSLDEALRISFL